MYQLLKKRVYGLLNPQVTESRYWDKVINSFIIVLILLNVVAVFLETVKPIEQRYRQFFYWFDLVSLVIFTLEYLLRVWSANADPKYNGSFVGRLKYMITLGAVIDLLAVLPFLIYMFFDMGLDLRELLLLRFFRVIRIFRLTSYTRSVTIIGNVFARRKNELVLSFVLLFFLILIASCLVYFAEQQHPINREKFSSIPATLWWSVVTLTTTGYGDMYPMTTAGKVITGIIILIGVAFFAIPAGILSAGFQEEFRRSRFMQTHRCPHCGELVQWDDKEHSLP